MAAQFPLLLSPVSAKERILTLGKNKIGETLKEFRTRYPKAICGRTISIDIKPQNLIKSGNMDDAHCCLNDSDSLAEISSFPILNFDDCAVHASFTDKKLESLTYVLDIRSIQTVLPSFEKFYGPPDRKLRHPDDGSKLIFVDWADGDTSLELILSQLGEDHDQNSKHAKGAPWLEAVTVSFMGFIMPTNKE